MSNEWSVVGCDKEGPENNHLKNKEPEVFHGERDALQFLSLPLGKRGNTFFFFF